MPAGMISTTILAIFVPTFLKACRVPFVQGPLGHIDERTGTRHEGALPMGSRLQLRLRGTSASRGGVCREQDAECLEARPVGAFGVGLAQAAALVPGVSRSGATITFGLFLGLRREEAARFSFLMSVPVTAAAAGLSLTEAVGEGMSEHQATMFLVGSVSSAVVGYLAIKFLLSFLARRSLRIFAYYRFVLAVVVAVAVLWASS
jgi:undecaprenyl pyrophosphate phosphatase UppP